MELSEREKDDIWAGVIVITMVSFFIIMSFISI
jgi:hypothetical protein